MKLWKKGVILLARMLEITQIWYLEILLNFYSFKGRELKEKK